MSTNTQATKESDVCNFIGWVLFAIGLIAGFVFIMVFGRLEVPIEVAGTYYGTRKEWSGTMIFVGIGIMFNGFIIGYLFQKIASLLRYQEEKIN